MLQVFKNAKTSGCAWSVPEVLYTFLRNPEYNKNISSVSRETCLSAIFHGIPQISAYFQTRGPIGVPIPPPGVMTERQQIDARMWKMQYHRQNILTLDARNHPPYSVLRAA